MLSVYMLWYFCRLFFVVSFSSLVLLAQSQIGGATLNGTVTDPTGAVIAGAKVVATNPATGFTREANTTSAGLYSFTQLPVGSYDVSVESAGFKTAKQVGVPLAIGAVSTLNIALEVGTSQETVSVNAELPVVETTRSQTSTNVSEKQVSDLPINGRNFLDFTVLTPGVVRDPRGGDVSFGGQRGTSNSLLIDGADNNNVFFGQTTGRSGVRNPYSFSQDAVQEFQVNTNGYAAEIGRAGGGVINVVTKSGNNEFHGGAFEFYRDKALNANSWENNRNNRPKGAYHYNQFGGNIGGPIKKDKVFFFFDYDGQRNTTPNIVFLQVAPPADPLSQQGAALLQPYLGAYANTLNNDVYLGKVDVNLTSNQHFSVRYNANRFKGQNFENSGPSSALEHTGNSNISTDNVAATYSAVLSPSLVFEGRFGYTRDDEPGQANSTAPEAVIRQAGTAVLSIGRNNFSPRYTNVKTYQGAANLSWVKGSHTFKFGTDIIHQGVANFFPGNFSGSYVFNSYADFATNRPFSFTQAFAGENTDGPLSNPNVSEYAVFLQDSWRATRKLTLNYGIRYDYFDLAQAKVKNSDPGLAALGLDTSRIPRDQNNVGPRFGFAYNLDDNGKSVIRGGYGIFYGRTPSIFTGTAFTQNGIQVQTYTLSRNLPAYPNILTAPPPSNRTPDLFVFAPDYVQPMTHQWSFNYERQLGKDLALTIGYLGVRGEHLTRSRDINLFPAQPVMAALSTGGTLTFLRHPAGRPNPNFGRITLAESGANSIYHGGFVQLTKRLAQNFQLQTSYTWSKVIDDAPDATAVVVGTDDSKLVQDTLNPGADRGLGAADVRHRFVFSGIWDLNYVPSGSHKVVKVLLGGWQLSTIATVQSGLPFSSTTNADLNSDGNTRSDRTPGEGRNAISGRNFLNDDVRLTKYIPLSRERVRLRLMFEAFNVTNRANYNALRLTRYNYTQATNTFSPAADYLAPTTTFAPRILQLAAKITF